MPWNVLGRRERIVVVGCLALSLTLVRHSPGEDWGHWRGTRRTGVVDEPSGWSAGDWPVRQAWEANLGTGGTSPLVVDGRLYTLGWHAAEDHVQCLDAMTGGVLWTQSYRAPERGRHATGDEGLYGGPSSTPELDSSTGYLYTLGNDGDLNCWDTRIEGRRVWNLNLYDAFQVPQRPRIGRSGHRDYGFTSSPLVHGDWLLVEAGSPDGNVLALNKQTGELVWRSQCQDEAGHTAGPVPIVVEGVPCVAVLTLRHLVVIRLDAKHAGETVAEYEWVTDFANNIASPAVHENDVLITSSYNHGSICKLRITLAGAERIWEQPFSSSICTPVVHRGNVYFCWQQLRCLDLATGEQRWSGGAFGDAGSCVVTADDRLIVWAGRGTLVLAETSPRAGDAYTELARIDDVFQSDVWPHVVLADGRLYCKDREGHLKCFVIGR